LADQRSLENGRSINPTNSPKRNAIRNKAEEIDPVRI